MEYFKIQLNTIKSTFPPSPPRLRRRPRLGSSFDPTPNQIEGFPTLSNWVPMGIRSNRYFCHPIEHQLEHDLMGVIHS